MTEIGWATLNVVPSFDGFQRKLEAGTNGGMLSAGTSGGTAFGGAAGKSAAAKFGSVFKTAAKASLIGAAALGVGALKFGGDAIEEAREAQKVGALTEAVIKSTGGTANTTAKAVARLSSSLSEQVGIDDEIIQRGANMVLTFKNVRNEAGKGNKIFDRTTKAVTDLAAGMAGGKGGEIDLKSSSVLLGKALNDPVAGLSALGRVGIKFTDQQVAINKALVEGGELNALNAIGISVTSAEFTKAMQDNKTSAEEQVRLYTGPMSDAQQKYFDHLTEGGNALEAQKNILKEVNSQFGGAAKAQATEAEKLAVAWGNFKEEIGEQLLPVLDKLIGFLTDKGIPAAREFAGWFAEKAVPKLKRFGDFIKDEIFPILEDLGGFLRDAGEFGADALKFFNNLPSEAKIAALGALVTGGVGLKVAGGGGGALGTAGKALGLAKPVPVFVTNPGGLGGVGGAPVPAGGKLGKIALTVGKLVLPAAAFEIVRQNGGDEFGDGAYKAGSVLGKDSSIPERIARVNAALNDVTGGLGSLIGDEMDDLIKLSKGFDTLPKTLQSRFNLLGVPETEKELRGLLRTYEITAKDRRTTLELLGYNPLLDQIERVNKELDWAARPREARINITKAYAAAGYETRGGLQEGGGGPRNGKSMGGYWD